ncbi:MAG: quinol:electron acceptor oxidoreductase subunit ActD [Syntrophorhabdales bacterium]
MKNDALVGTFVYVDDFLSCLTALTQKKYEIASAFSPVRLPEMQEILTSRPSPTRTFALVGGILGGVGLLTLATIAHLSFKLIVWGKPVLPWVPWVVVAFEGTILGCALFSFVSWVFTAGLPQPTTDFGYDPGFSGHRFGLVVPVTGENRGEIENILKEKGAEEVRHVAA